MFLKRLVCARLTAVAAPVLIFAVLPGEGFADAKRIAPGARVPQVTVSKGPGMSALTATECTKLGGEVNADSAECTKKGQFTCKTITRDGAGNTHVNTACIDEVSTK